MLWLQAVKKKVLHHFVIGVASDGGLLFPPLAAPEQLLAPNLLFLFANRGLKARLKGTKRVKQHNH